MRVGVVYDSKLFGAAHFYSNYDCVHCPFRNRYNDDGLSERKRRSLTYVMPLLAAIICL